MIRSHFILVGLFLAENKKILFMYLQNSAYYAQFQNSSENQMEFHESKINIIQYIFNKLT